MRAQSGARHPLIFTLASGSDAEPGQTVSAPVLAPDTVGVTVEQGGGLGNWSSSGTRMVESRLSRG